MALTQRYSRLHLVVLMMALLFLSGCVSIPMQPDNERVQQLKQMRTWTVKGRISLKTPKENFIANLLWRQQEKGYLIRIYNNLGQTYAQISQTGSSMITLEFDKKKYHGKNAQKLLKAILGWDLPIKEMAEWIKGYNLSKRSSSKKNENGTLRSLSYKNWFVDFNRYAQYKKRILPTQIELKNTDILLKISIHDWKFE